MCITVFRPKSELSKKFVQTRIICLTEFSAFSRRVPDESQRSWSQLTLVQSYTYTSHPEFSSIVREKKRRVLVARRRGKKCCLTIIRSNIRRRILRVRVTSCVPRPAVLQTSWNVSRKKIQIFPSQILCWKYWLLARPGLQKWEKKYGRAPRGSLSVRQIDLSSPPRVYFCLFRKEVTPG